MIEDAFDAVVPSPLGRLGLHTGPKGLCSLEYVGNAVLLKPPSTELCKQVMKALAHYFDGGGLHDDLPLDPQGTPFQRRVWSALRAIPTGQVITYGELAKRLGSGPRAVGGACRHNPIPILVPCHRVVGKADNGGYAGHKQGPMMMRKQWLLAHEGVLEPLPIAL